VPPAVDLSAFQALLVLAYKYKKMEDFAALLATAQQQCAAAGPSTLSGSQASGSAARGFEAVVAIYAAVSTMSGASGEGQWVSAKWLELSDAQSDMSV
jgi:hypothetical protein